MKRLSPASLMLVLCMCPFAGTAQNFIDLDFSQNVQATDGIYPNNSTLGPEYYSGFTFDFLNVGTVGGTSIDARVSILGSAGGYEFVGWLPDYNTAPGGPEGDLGVYYRFNGDYNQPTGGIAYTMSFYQGGGTFTDSVMLPDVRILIYDHDGEDMQSEHIRTYLADGFVGHQLHQNSDITAYDEGATWRFDARGMNHSETSENGGFIAYYQNTSSIRFDMFSTTTVGPAANFGIFAAFDGDLSLTGESTSHFTSFTHIPEPSSALFVAATISLSLLRRRRP